jgi:hypothetical protein
MPPSKWVEIGGQSGSLSCGLETGVEVDRRSRYGVPAERLAVEANVGQLVFRRLFDELADRLFLELGFVSTHHPTGVHTGIGVADALAGRGAQIELSLHVFEVQRERENVLVVDRCSFLADSDAGRLALLLGKGRRKEKSR